MDYPYYEKIRRKLTRKRDEFDCSRGGVSDGRVDMPARFQRSQDHHEAYLKLIRWELDDEMDAVTEKLQNWPQKKLEANGITIFNLVGKAAGWLFGQRIIKFNFYCLFWYKYTSYII